MIDLEPLSSYDKYNKKISNHLFHIINVMSGSTNLKLLHIKEQMRKVCVIELSAKESELTSLYSHHVI